MRTAWPARLSSTLLGRGSPPARWRRWPLLLAAASLVVPLAALAGPAAAATATPGPNTPTQVPMGIDAAALPGASVFEGVPGDTPETVSFILKEQDVSSLERQVESGVRNYLSVSQFARTYGQSTSNIEALTSYLAGFGIKSTVFADNVDVSTTGTAQDYDSALSVTEKIFSVPAHGGIPARNSSGTSQAPLLPYRLANFVEAILGLSNYPPFSTSLAHVNNSYLPPQSSPTAPPGNGAYCLASTGLPDACNLPSNFASNYDLNGLYSKGADGQDGAGQAVGPIARRRRRARLRREVAVVHVGQRGAERWVVRAQDGLHEIRQPVRQQRSLRGSGRVPRRDPPCAGTLNIFSVTDSALS